MSIKEIYKVSGNKLTDYETARMIIGGSIIGPEELELVNKRCTKDFNRLHCHIKLNLPDEIMRVPFSIEELESKKNDYLLVYGIGSFSDGSLMTIRNLIRVFGSDPHVFEPCFYNQDWYYNEDFIDCPMKEGWFLIRRNVFEDSRAVQPTELKEKYSFPSAIRCTYAFFTAWLSLNIKLWYHDFVWCSDIDHNGDQIYVGKYNDIDGVNKNGFSIHRHLSLRECYGCID